MFSRNLADLILIDFHVHLLDPICVVHSHLPEYARIFERIPHTNLEDMNPQTSTGR